MKRRSSRLSAILAAVALCVQSTGAANLPVALMSSGGAFPPAALRLGAFPAARPAFAAPVEKVPVGPSWLDRAHLVAASLFVRVLDTVDPPPSSAPIEMRREEPARAPEPLPPPAADEPVITALNPGVDSPADRMMVKMGTGERVEAVLDNNFRSFLSAPPTPASGPRTLPSLPDKWIAQNGLSARITYLNPSGVVTGVSSGFLAVMADGRSKLLRQKEMPAAYLRDFPIYWHGQVIEMELTVENRTGRTLNGLRLEATQEKYNLAGTEAAAYGPPAVLTIAATLPPNGVATVRWYASLRGPNPADVNFEQTHVRLSEAGAKSALLDAPQAGIIDPPGPGVL